jgi:hypothetical protein
LRCVCRLLGTTRSSLQLEIRSADGGITDALGVGSQRELLTQSGPRCGCQFALQPARRSAAIPLQKIRCGYFRAEDTLPCNKRKPGSGCSALNGINDKHAIFGWSEACVATQPSDPATALAALGAIYVATHRDASAKRHGAPLDGTAGRGHEQPLIAGAQFPLRAILASAAN